MLRAETLRIFILKARSRCLTLFSTEYLASAEYFQLLLLESKGLELIDDLPICFKYVPMLLVGNWICLVFNNFYLCFFKKILEFLSSTIYSVLFQLWRSNNREAHYLHSCRLMLSKCVPLVLLILKQVFFFFYASIKDVFLSSCCIIKQIQFSSY